MQDCRQVNLGSELKFELVASMDCDKHGFIVVPPSPQVYLRH